MPFIAGKTSTFSLDNAGGTLTAITSYVDSVDFPRAIDTYETTTLGANDKTYIVGLRGATFSISGPWDATIDAHMAGVLGQSATLSFSYSPNGSLTYTGECIVTSYDISSPVGDKLTWSANLQVTGAVTRT